MDSIYGRIRGMEKYHVCMIEAVWKVHGVIQDIHRLNPIPGWVGIQIDAGINYVHVLADIVGCPGSSKYFCHVRNMKFIDEESRDPSRA